MPAQIPSGLAFSSKGEQPSLAVPRILAHQDICEGLFSWGRMFFDVKTLVAMPAVCPCRLPLAHPALTTREWKPLICDWLVSSSSILGPFLFFLQVAAKLLIYVPILNSAL